MTKKELEDKVSMSLLGLCADWSDVLVICNEDEEKGKTAKRRFRDELVPKMAELVIEQVQSFDREQAVAAPKVG